MEYKIQLYFGDGKGKTCAALGRAIRWLGGGGKLCFVQFLKDGKSNEINIISSLPNVTLLFEKENFGFTWLMTEEKKQRAARAYLSLLDKAVKWAAENPGGMLVLDELGSLIEAGLADEEYIIDKIRGIKGRAEIVITAHNPGQGLIDLSDYASQIKKIKHPYDEGLPRRKGVEF